MGTRFICAHCGEPAEAFGPWQNRTKYCKICQIVRDNRVASPGQRVCDTCSTNFWPLRPGKGWSKCPDCALMFTLQQRAESKGCTICGRRIPPAIGLENTCLNCVCSQKEYRAQYLKKLREIVANRVENNFAKRVNTDGSVV